MMVALMDALYAAIRLFIPDSDTLPLVEFPGGIGSISQGSFTVDKSLGGEVKFTLIYYDLGHVGNMINLIDPHGMVKETLNLQEEDGDVNMIFVTITNAMAGEWHYRVENRADSHQSLFTRVLATPRAPNSTSSSSMGHGDRDAHAITLTAWTSSTATVVNISDVSKPVIVYAQETSSSMCLLPGSRLRRSFQFAQ
ncbi:hypothetical protein C7M84_011106 [Penaeus vannamei]|uniref:Uncharacterized protein n=1 Tax=Penaeus vannamei TaxID=6689 RepID=A0A3R7M359_PENVA|nr:hypothetical protein C7M84_011106 [Penaeus vannamei]